MPLATSVPQRCDFPVCHVHGTLASSDEELQEDPSPGFRERTFTAPHAMFYYDLYLPPIPFTTGMIWSCFPPQNTPQTLYPRVQNKDYKFFSAGSQNYRGMHQNGNFGEGKPWQ